MRRGNPPLNRPHNSPPPAYALPRAADFSRIAEKIAAGAYASLRAWLEDVALITSNCGAYNPSGSAIAASAKRLDALVEALRADANYRAAQEASAPEGSAMEE